MPLNERIYFAIVKKGFYPNSVLLAPDPSRVVPDILIRFMSVPSFFIDSNCLEYVHVLFSEVCTIRAMFFEDQLVKVNITNLSVLKI